LRFGRAEPYYLLENNFSWSCGLFRLLSTQGQSSVWVWILPTAYLAMEIILWTPATALEEHNWHTTFAHFFVGTPPRYPEGNVTIPFYTSLSYAFGALFDKGNVFRFQRPTAGAAVRTPIHSSCSQWRPTSASVTQITFLSDDETIGATSLYREWRARSPSCGWRTSLVSCIFFLVYACGS